LACAAVQFYFGRTFGKHYRSDWAIRLCLSGAVRN
jgi:hypothetical protein